MNDARLLQQAKRCQLLIGSHSDSSLICDCYGKDCCSLTEAQRMQLKNHPKVLAAKKRNRELYERLKDDQQT